ncbi:DUF3108 domain-containing protein [Hyphococcus flavus]|uniref:DUF3108 domain-containing protein n=1 Tax=Hyphococcus flavus TaxID=1866326 RepID=A0AAE9ZJN4_9PROT|nr:DUF3108 domain-containing protein [Hyphococcus flavus]WDI31800.1 DUF3108 domain-containing protein [Hyphococcus flavus]
MKKQLGLIGAGVCVWAGAAMADPLPVDRDKVEFGEMTFRLMLAGEEKGEMFYALEQRDDVLVLHDGSTMMPSTRESLTAVFDAETLAPRSIVLDADFSRTVLDADLEFTGGKATGLYRIKQPDQLDKTDRPFDLEIPEHTVFRGSVFGLASGLPLEEGDVYNIKWFASLAGAVQDVELAVEGEETVTVPAGEFETIKLHVKAQPENMIYVTKASPRRIVRIDVIGMDMVFERMP